MIFDILADEIRRKKNPTCAGLDTHLGCLPPGFRNRFDTNSRKGLPRRSWPTTRS